MWSLWKRLFGEHFCHREQLVDAVDEQHSTASAGCFEDFVATSERASVRCCRLRCRLRMTSFENDNWFGQGNFPGSGEERTRIANGLQVDDDARGLRVATQIINQIAPANVDHRANGDKGAEPNVFTQAPIQHGRAKSTALADETNMARPSHSAGKGGVESGQWAHYTHAIWTNDA